MARLRPDFAMPLALLVGGGVLFSGCEGSVVVEVRTGPRSFAFEALALPDAMRDPSSEGARVARIGCGSATACPESGEVTLRCEDAVCDPAPTTVTVPLHEVIDVDELAVDARTLLRTVEWIEVRSASYAIASNTMSGEVPPVELLWGPADADAATAMGRIGVVAPIAPRSTRGGAIALDPDGLRAFSAYLVSGDRRARLFARTVFDVEPDGPFPEGAVTVEVAFDVRIVGSLVR